MHYYASKCACELLHHAEVVCTVVCVCVCECVCGSVGFGPVTVEGPAGMSITHTVQLSVSYKENRVEGGREESPRQRFN